MKSVFHDFFWLKAKTQILLNNVRVAVKIRLELRMKRDMHFTYESGKSVVIACEYPARERVERNLSDRNRKKPTIMPS